jgi:hypothetical protein
MHKLLEKNKKEVISAIVESKNEQFSKILSQFMAINAQINNLKSQNQEE